MAAGGCPCLAKLEAFALLMQSELSANIDKGGRTAWLAYAPRFLLSEIFDHGSKLHVAAVELLRRRSGEPSRPMPWGTDMEQRVREFAADVANMAMMLLDKLDLLPPPEPDDVVGRITAAGHTVFDRDGKTVVATTRSDTVARRIARLFNESRVQRHDNVLAALRRLTTATRAKVAADNLFPGKADVYDERKAADQELNAALTDADAALQRP